MSIRWVLLVAWLGAAGEWAWGQSFEGMAYGGVVGAQISGDGMAGFNKGGAMGGFSVVRPLSQEWSWRWGLEVASRGSARSAKEALEGRGRWERLRVSYVETPAGLFLRVPRTPWRLGVIASVGIRWEGYMVNAFGAEEPIDFLRRTDLNARLAVEYLRPSGWMFFFQTGQSLIGIGKGWSRPVLFSAYPGLLHLFIAAGIGYEWTHR